MTDPTTTDRPHLDVIASALEDWWLITDPAQPFDTRVVAQAVDARLTRSGYRIAPDTGRPPAHTTCDASTAGLAGDTLGPCILRHGHDGPVHKDATGATWWPARHPTPPSRAGLAFAFFLFLCCLTGATIALARGDWWWLAAGAFGAVLLGQECVEEITARRTYTRRNHP
ncbi:hypothetical protein ACPCK1_02765 [Streptomyces pseudogriseolus]|uniref:hypothetical protein n=1 Tax=Streptomyces pseudogriseolus TaxID=36817 RepID=UPI003FA3310C